jgi:hypothetical protein
VYLKDVYKPEYVERILKEKKTDLNLVIAKVDEVEKEKENIDTIEA